MINFNKYLILSSLCKFLSIAFIFNMGVTKAYSQASDMDVICSLKNIGEQYSGVCSIPCRVNALNANFDKLLELCTSISPPRNVLASLKKIDESGNYLGRMEGKYPEDPTRFEIADSRYSVNKVAKLPFGWFPVKSINHANDEIIFIINADKVLSATLDDLKIINRTMALLNNVSVWNKNDNRICPANPGKLSLFCALTQATVEISGGVHYRQPAHEKVREVLNEVGGSRVKTHRLMDYNNHPDTTLDDVHSLLRKAGERIIVK